MLNLGLGLGLQNCVGGAPDNTLSGSIDGVVFEIDATNEDSYSGTGTNWANLTPSPADGSGQSAYDFTNTDFVFTGTAGDNGAYWLQNAAANSGVYFEIAGGNTTFLNGLHKTTGGTPWTLLCVLQKNTTTGQIRTMSTTDNNHGILAQTQSSGNLNLLHTPGFNGPVSTNALQTSSAQFQLVAYAFDPGTGNWELRKDSVTKETGSFSPTASTTDAGINMLLGAYSKTSAAQITTRFKFFAMTNSIISDSDYSAVQTYVTDLL